MTSTEVKFFSRRKMTTFIVLLSMRVAHKNTHLIEQMTTCPIQKASPEQNMYKQIHGIKE